MPSDSFLLAETTGGIGMAVIVVIAVLALLVFKLIFAKFFNLWLQARVSGAPVAYPELMGMSLRKVDPRSVVEAHIKLTKAGIDVGLPKLETHYLAGGNIQHMADAMVIARNGGVDVTWHELAREDLGGRDVVAQTRELVRVTDQARANAVSDEST